MVRVLHIVGVMGMGGQETFIMNLYRNIDRSKIQFDFVVHSNEKGFFDDEIESLGGKIYRITPMSANIFKHLKELKKIIKQNKYNIIHRHTASSIVALEMFIAKTCGVKHRIVHSHNTSSESKFMHYFLRPFLNIFSNYKFACSDLAGRWLFGKNSKFEVIPNAIETEKFKFSKLYRDEIRKKYNISDDILLIGNVGAFREQKNHIWLLKMFKELLKINTNYKLMICGDGKLRNDIEKEISENNLQNNIILTGNVNTYKFYNAFDVFVLPSKWEGLGIVLIEAQISNLPCIVSTQIQDEAIISDNVEKLELDNMNWIEKIEKCSINKERENLDCFKYEKYDIYKLSKKLEEKYINKL